MRRARRRGGARGRIALGASCAVAGLVTLVAACGPVPAGDSNAAPPGESTNTATYAMEAGGQAAYPFPFLTLDTSQFDSVFNINDYQYLLYRPLYWFGRGAYPYVNPSLSLAYAPKYTGHQVSITLKHYLWSNGTTVTADDVRFWLNMMIAEGANGVDYSPSGLPVDIDNIQVPSRYTITFDIKSPQFSESWFDNNELSEITPMPAAWDRTASGPSDCDTNVSACTAVYSYLNAQASLNPKTFPSSPLWSIVDGPWKLQKLTSQGYLELKYNPRYSGKVPAHHITTFIELPFISEQAEYNVLQDPTTSEAIDVGYLPTVDAPIPPAGANVGSNPASLSDYRLSALYVWQLSYFPYNFSNTTGQGAIFRQLYFRQAFQDLVDQEGVINGPMHGYGKPTIGPVGDYPVTQYLSPSLSAKGDQWKLDIATATSLLTSHGWAAKTSGGTDVCVHAGSGPADCGPGIPAGAKLSFTLMYATGVDWMESAARELASNASLAGMSITLDALPFDDVVSAAFGPCTPKSCTWQLALWGDWTYAPDYLPTGDELFESGEPNNAGHYSNATNDALIQDTLDARTSSEFKTAIWKWQNYLAGQLPVVYMPDAPTLLETVKGLNIGVQNSALNITPEDWYYQK
jgi:peptide/nickel transport system substrate-binding protein